MACLVAIPLKGCSRLFGPQCFNDCFMDWTNSICELAQGEVVAIDGMDYLHWTLDVLFREGVSRKRKGNAAENFNIILKVALGMIVKETILKKSKKNKRMLAACDYRYREKIMGLS